MIHEGDLTVVGSPLEPAPEGLGRDVRQVGVEEVDPQQERRPEVVQPGQHRFHGLARRPLFVVEGRPIADAHAVVVDLEAARQTEPTIEDHR